MFSDLYQTLMEINIFSIFLRLLMAVVFGGIIGLDRGSKRRPAGMRTYILVCIGSALVMITSQFISEIYAVSDPARLGAQVISGIGFLGVGTIIVTRTHQVKGLTTAAGLWATACMGLAIGVGFYEGAFIGMIFIFTVITVLHHFDNKIMRNSKVMDLYIEINQGYKISDILKLISDNDMEVSYLDIIKNKEDISVLATVRLPKRMDHYEVISGLVGDECIAYIEET